MADKSEMLRSLSIDRQEEASGPGWGVVIAALLIGAGVAGSGVWLLKPQPTSPLPVSTASTPVESPAATAVRPPSGLIASGFVVARRQATVSAEVTGRVTEVRVEEGQTVKAGEILGVLDSVLQRADLATARARLAANEAQVTGLKTNLVDARRIAARALDLADKGLGTRAAADTSATTVTALEAQIRQAEAQVTAQQAEIDRLTKIIDRFVIRAPFDGVVTTKAAQVGEIISPVSAGGGFTRTGLCTLVDMSSLEIEVDVNESFIARVRDDMPVEAVLDAYPDIVFPARVIATIPTASRDRATVRVRIGFQSIDPRILPEMAIKVTFIESKT